jgi:hypothetical protein
MDDDDGVTPPARRGGWRGILTDRDFARDILVTTIGVLLALAIGEIATDWRKRRDAEQAVLAMRRDAVPNVTALVEREVIARCVTKRLDQLRELMDSARTTGTLPDIEPIGRPPARPLPRTAWEVALGQGATSHVEPQVGERLRFFYDTIAKFEEVSNSEQASWNMLKLLEDRPGRWPAEMTADLYRAHIYAQDHNRLIGLMARQALRRSHELGIPWRTFSNEPVEWRRVIDTLLERPICKPLMVDGRVYRAPPAKS